MLKQWQLAQLNVATAMYEEGDDRMAGFYSRLDEINALAEASEGFIWRLQSDSGNATDIVVEGNPALIVNLTVWRSVEAVFDFAYKTVHRELLAKRREWFSRPDGAYQVLWWVPAGHQPSVEEAMAKLRHLQDAGAGPLAFTFKKKFPHPDGESDCGALDPDAYCSGWD